jgi:hypothetical protein
MALYVWFVLVATATHVRMRIRELTIFTVDTNSHQKAMAKDHPKRDGGSAYCTFDGLPAWAVAPRDYLKRCRTRHVILTVVVMGLACLTLWLATTNG